MFKIDARTGMIAAAGAVVLGIYGWKARNAKDAKLAMWIAGGALLGAAIDVVGIKMVLKK